jgi:hypothetical protein
MLISAIASLPLLAVTIMQQILRKVLLSELFHLKIWCVPVLFVFRRSIPAKVEALLARGKT